MVDTLSMNNFPRLAVDSLPSLLEQHQALADRARAEREALALSRLLEDIERAGMEDPEPYESN